jgi:predicted nucleic acid-binding protein
MTSPPLLFVETNFVLGHALGEHDAYETILGAAEAKRLHLLVPAFSIYEAFQKLSREGELRERWSKDLRLLGEQLEKKHLNPDRSNALIDAAAHLRNLVDDHGAGLKRTVERLRLLADLVPVGPIEVDDAVELRKRLAKGDPWICACLRTALRSSSDETPAFLTTDDTFAHEVEAWGSVGGDPLLAPFAGLRVYRHPAKVVADWSL